MLPCTVPSRPCYQTRGVCLGSLSPLHQARLTHSHSNPSQSTCRLGHAAAQGATAWLTVPLPLSLPSLPCPALPCCPASRCVCLGPVLRTKSQPTEPLAKQYTGSTQWQPRTHTTTRLEPPPPMTRSVFSRRQAAWMGWYLCSSSFETSGVQHNLMLNTLCPTLLVWPFPIYTDLGRILHLHHLTWRQCTDRRADR